MGCIYGRKGSWPSEMDDWFDVKLVRYLNAGLDGFSVYRMAGWTIGWLVGRMVGYPGDCFGIELVWYMSCMQSYLENLVDGICGCLVGWFGDFNAGLDGLSGA